MQHVHVDGVSLGSIFPAHRIVGAAAAGLRPPRICVALVLLAFWMCCGAAWDLSTPARVSPRGIAFGPLDDATLEEAHRIMEAAALNVVPEADVTHASGSDLAELVAGSVDGASDDEAREQALAALRAIDAVRPRGAFEAWTFALRERLFGLAEATLTLHWSSLPDRVMSLVWRLPLEAVGVSWSFAGYLALLFAVGMGWIGVVLARMGARDLSDDPAPTFAQARAWGVAVRPSALGAMAVPALGMAFCLCIAAAPGVLGVVPLLGVFGALGFGVSLLFGMLAVLVGASISVALPFVIPAVATDAADAVEAPQRALAAVLARPVHAAVHLALVLCAIVLATAAVDVVVSCGFDAAASAWGMLGGGEGFAPIGRMVPLGVWTPSPAVGLTDEQAAEAWLFGFWRLVASALIGAALLSVTISACTRAWLFQRQAAEGQHPSDILERP